jgi:hypothetical protein
LSPAAGRRRQNVAPRRDSRARAGCPKVRLALAFLLLALALPAFGQVKDFKWPEYFQKEELGEGQTNRLKTLVTGREGQALSASQFLLTEPQITRFTAEGATNLVARSQSACSTPNGARWLRPTSCSSRSAVAGCSSKAAGFTVT